MIKSLFNKFKRYDVVELPGCGLGIRKLTLFGFRYLVTSSYEKNKLEERWISRSNIYFYHAFSINTNRDKLMSIIKTLSSKPKLVK